MISPPPPFSSAVSCLKAPCALLPLPVSLHHFSFFSSSISKPCPHRVLPRYLPPCQQQSKYRCCSSFCQTLFTITVGGLQQLFFCLKAQRCCFTSTDTIRLTWDGETRTATSTFALSPQKPSGLLGTGSPGRPVSLKFDFHFTSTETIRLIRDVETRTATSTFALSPQKLSGLLGTGSPGRSPRLSL